MRLGQTTTSSEGEDVMRISLMVEGQNGLTWERWSHILALAERLGMSGVYRSDHYFIGQQQDSLEAYLSFVMAASETSTIRFGALVSPVTFRRPVDVGRMVAQLDALSDGRFICGFGAGWNEPEHVAYGIDFPSTKERFDRMDDAIRLMKALWSGGPVSYDGEFYSLKDADCLPRPPSGRPYFLIGGSGEKRTLRSVAEFADEWNFTPLPFDEIPHKIDVLAKHCETFDRDPASIRRSQMTFGLIGPDDLLQPTVRALKAARGAAEMSDADFLQASRDRGSIVGGTDEVVDQIGRLAELGVEEMMFQHFLFDDDSVPEYLATEIAPQVADL